MSKPEGAGAVNLVLNADTTLGIVAGLTLAYKQQQRDADGDDGHDDEDDNNARAALSMRRRSSCAADSQTSGREIKAKKPPSRGGGTAEPPPGATAATITVPAAAAAGTGAGPSSPGPRAKLSVHDQRDAIRRMQERNQILKQELSIELRDAKLLLANDKRQRLEYLQRTIATFTKKIEAARRGIGRLDEQIARKEHELETLRQQHYSSAESGGGAMSTGQATNEAGETSAAINRRLRSLENRLELTLVKRNEMDSINKHLRSQIEKVRKDRAIFDGIYKKLERELSEFKTRYDASMDELQRAMGAKERVNGDILRLQAQSEAEQRAYEQQFAALKAEIEVAMREARALRASGVPSFVEEGEESRSAPSPSPGSGDGKAGAASATATSRVGHSQSHHHHHHLDSPLKRISALSSWKIGFDKAVATTNDSIVAKYDRVFEGIKRMTGITDITKIAEAITRNDEDNFKRFKHVEELHREEVLLRAEVEQVTAAIEEFKAQEGIATNSSQKQQYRVLEAKYQQVLERNKAFDAEYEETTTELTRLKSSIHSIHSMLVHANCAKNVDQFSQGGSHVALGSHSARDITDANVLEYLQAIEIFTSSLMKENHEAAALGDGGSPTHIATAGGGGGGGSAFAPTLVVSSPISHGPTKLSADPTQKLRVHVPSFGGLNGVIVLPPSSEFLTGASMSKLQQQQQQPQQLQQQQQLQQRKKTARFELASQRSLQFPGATADVGPGTPGGGSGVIVSAVASPPGSSSTSSSSLDAALSLSAPPSASTSHAGDRAPPTLPRGPNDDEEEGERAFTYDELRDFAARHVLQRREDASPPRRPTKRAA